MMLWVWVWVLGVGCWVWCWVWALGVGVGAHTHWHGPCSDLDALRQTVQVVHRLGVRAALYPRYLRPGELCFSTVPVGKA